SPSASPAHRPGARASGRGWAVHPEVAEQPSAQGVSPMSESDDKITVRSDPLGMLDTAKQLAASGITGPIGSIGNLASALSFPGTWKRIGLGALGIWLCWLGVLLILSQ